MFRVDPPARPGGWYIPVLPDDIAGCGVEGLQNACALPEIHDPVANERRQRAAAVGQRERPRQPQCADVCGRDLRERAVPVRVARPPPVQPVLRRRVLQDCLCDRREARNGTIGIGQRRDPRFGRSQFRREAGDGDLRRNGRRGSRALALTNRQRGIGSQRDSARGMSVRLEYVRHDGEIVVIAECAAAARRHLATGVGEELARRAPAPRGHERVSRQRLAHRRAVERGAVAERAVLLVRRLSRGGLRGGESTGGCGPLSEGYGAQKR